MDEETHERYIEETHESDIVAIAHENVVSGSTLDGYRRSMARFILYIHQHEPSLVNEPCADLITRINHDSNGLTASKKERKLRLRLKTWLTENPAVPPLDCTEITAEHLIRWIGNVKKSSGGFLSGKSMNTHRSAFSWLCVQHKVQLSTQFTKRTSDLLKGLKRTATAEQQAGNTTAKDGKDAMSFESYRLLSERFFLKGSRDAIFGHCFMVLMWNLMSRAMNVEKLTIQHIDWEEDAMAIRFSQMKNDQLGERPKDARHLYASPKEPITCPVLCLGIFYLSFNGSAPSNYVFSGSKQYARFSRILKDELKAIRDDGSNPSLSSKDIGTHSLRKGSSSYCSSGSTACPPFSAISIRAGWKLPGVVDTYVRYEAAGDRYVGRTAVGLSIGSTDFAVLPPHFEGTLNEYQREAIDALLPMLNEQHGQLKEMLVASLLFHKDFLLAKLPRTHPIFVNSLFSPDFLNLFSNLSIVSGTFESRRMRATGVPPHIFLIAKLESMMERLEGLKQYVGTESEATRQFLIDELEKRALQANTLSLDGFLNRIDDHLEDALQRLGIGPVQSESPGTVQSSAVALGPTGNVEWYFWGNAYRRLPLGYQMPIMNPNQAVLLWFNGCQELQIPPLQSTCKHDFSNVSEYKKSRELAYIVKKCFQSLSRNEHGVVDLTTIVSVWNDYISGSGLSTRESGSHRGRLNQQSFLTIAKIIRKHQNQ